MKEAMKKIAELECLIKQGKSTDVVIILCHGYGANANDLAPLANVLDQEGQWTWVFPEAPLSLNIEPGFMGKAWFPLSLSEAPSPEKWLANMPDGLMDASKKLADLISELNRKGRKIFLGGFSQGAMVSLNTLLEHDITLQGLFLLSGTLLAKETWQKKASKRPGVPFFLSHGQSDMVLPYSLSVQLYQLLIDSGWDGEKVSFSGGHEIPGSVQKGVLEFIQKQLSR